MRKVDQWAPQLEEEIFAPLGECVEEADDSLRGELQELLSQWASVRGKETADASSQSN
jgi:hypothetical protein